MFIKKFNSFSRIRKRVKFFEAHFQKELNSLSHLFKKEFNSLSHTFKKTLVLWVIFIKKFNSLSDIFEKGFKSLRHIQEIKRFNSLRHIQEIKRFNSQKISILWVGFQNSILWGFFFFWWKNFEPWKKRVHFFESKIFKKVQVFESREKEGSIRWCEKGPSIWIMKKKEGTVIWVKLRKNFQFFESYIQQKNSIFWVISKKGSILSILWGLKKNSILKIFKKFNSVSQF